MKIVGWLWVIGIMLLYLITGLWIYDLTLRLYGFKSSLWVIFTNKVRSKEYDRIDRENFGDAKVRRWLHFITFLIFYFQWAGLMAAIGLG